jgi:biopolymer transport protein ExbB
VLGILLAMSVGTWYIFFTKYLDQSKVLGQARVVERRFWSASSLNEGVDRLPKNSMFRAIAEAGVKASAGGTSLVGLNDWIAMSLARQLDDATGKLEGGVTFLASVGSVAPFVGLFGTVWGILQALIAIGVAGQASIDKVAGPVGEALIMTALGLAAAVPAVLLYNWLVRRNKVITEKLRGFAGDLQTFLITKSK